MSSPWKDPRSGIFYIRRGVPAKIKDQLGSFYKRSLQTKDPKEAKARFPLELAKCEKLFQEAKARAEKNKVEEISRDEADRLASIWLSQELEDDEDYRMEGLSDRDYYKLQETNHFVASHLKENLARGNTYLVEFDVDDFIYSHNLRIAKDSNAYKELSHAFLKASVRANTLIDKRNQGEVIETPSAPSVEPQMITSGDRNNDTFSNIYELWKAERKPSPKLISDWGGIVNRFKELHGDLLITEINRRHVASFKDAALQFPIRQPRAISKLPLPEIIKLFEGDEKVTRLSPSSAKKYLTVIRTVLEWAVENGFRDDNPASGIKIRVAHNTADTRLPYSDEDLSIIFNSPVYTTQHRPKAGAGEAAYWMPLLALYTGARLDELGQLLISDVRCDDGIWYIDLNTLDENKSLKTQSSKRIVPLHPALLNAGLTDYIATVNSSDKKKLLFPALTPDSKGKLTGNWSKWWGRYARKELGITDPRKVFHSFRHTFKDACRKAGLGEEVHDALTGHSGGGVGRQYGQGIQLNRLHDEITKIEYPEINFSHLKSV